MTSRREFIRKSALATVGTMLIPNFLKGFEQQAFALQQAKSQGKILVMIQLSGGNDGLNTIVPFRNDIYYRERPTIGIKADKVLKLNDEIGLNPALEAIRVLYDTWFDANYQQCRLPQSRPFAFSFDGYLANG
jgi:uncharacterized protein (DUF1501 family)